MFLTCLVPANHITGSRTGTLKVRVVLSRILVRPNTLSLRIGEILFNEK